MREIQQRGESDYERGPQRLVRQLDRRGQTVTLTPSTAEAGVMRYF
jgi:hypothetical protein